MKYHKFELNLIWANILSVVLFVLGFIFLLFTYKPIEFTEYGVGKLLIGMLLYLMIHEIIHGLAFSCFCKDKRSVKYGAALEKGVLYAMCQERISKKAIIISLLAPTVVLTLLALIPSYIFRIDLLAILAIFNLAGATGDLLMTLFVIKLPNNIQYIDYDSVIGFYLLSKDDLSKYKSPFLRYIESGKDSDKLINKDIKPLTITKASWIIFIILIIFVIISCISM